MLSAGSLQRRMAFSITFRVLKTVRDTVLL
jgi:hypothetical protein